MAGNGRAREPRLGVALGGGAALGWAHIGALRALEAHGIETDVIAGTSIGALVGACAAARVLDPLEDIARQMTWRRMIGYADPLFGAPGLFKGGALVDELCRYLGNRRIEDLDVGFAAVAADLISGEEVRINAGPIAEAVRASISIPGLFLPVEQGDGLLVDGGLVAPLPVAAVRALGAEVILAVDVTGDYHGCARAAGIACEPAPSAEKSSSAAGKGWLHEIAGRVFRRSRQRPGLYSIATTSAALMMRELALAKLALDPPDVHVVPKVGHVSPLDFDRADELIETGRVAMEGQLGKLMAILAARSRNFA